MSAAKVLALGLLLTGCGAAPDVAAPTAPVTLVSPSPTPSASPSPGPSPSPIPVGLTWPYPSCTPSTCSITKSMTAAAANALLSDAYVGSELQSCTWTGSDTTGYTIDCTSASARTALGCYQISMSCGAATTGWYCPLMHYTTNPYFNPGTGCGWTPPS